MPVAEGHSNVCEVGVAGVGLVTPLGHSAWATLSALLSGRTTADRLAELPDDVEPTALARATGGVGFGVHAPIDPAIDLSERAAREALSDAGIEPRSDASAGMKLLLASSKGAVMSLIAPRRAEHRSETVMLGPHGFLARQVQQRLGLGDSSAPVAACATSLVALDRAARAIQTGESDRAIVVAVESALHPIFVHSYRRLGALAPTTPAQAHIARPLDTRREGFTLCECAAAIVLERVNRRGPKSAPWGRLLRTVTLAEPYDLIRAPERFRAVERAASIACDGVGAIAFVQPHATGTPDNDEHEASALARALGDRANGAPAYAAKGAIGHGLGAAGLVNVVIGLLCARAKRYPPMPWLASPIDTPFSITRGGGALGPGAHLCVAAGFGGHVGAASFEPALRTS